MTVIAPTISPVTTTRPDLASLLSDADAINAQVIAWRRHLHQHPEVAFQEHETARYVRTVLEGMPGLIVSRPTETSVMARLVGAHPGRTIAVRADIDALPIHEENAVEYRSTIDGAMHACGHDGHTSIVLGLASILAPYQAHLAGEVRFFFQHAEELSPGGAEEMVQRGVMDGVDEVIGLHLWAPMPVGRIGIIAGPAMAAPDTFELTITGTGGHAAIPHETIDPIAVGAQVVSALQHIVSRNVDPLDPAVVSVTQFHAGTTFNVIPSSAQLSGTVRTFDPALRVRIPVLMERIIKGVCDREDARLAMDAGADAVSVSNHGGNHLDSSASTISMLPDVVEGVAGRGEVLLDGGVRSGQDILKAMALGAKGVLLGRAHLYGLGAAGQKGVAKALDILKYELDVSVGLTGLTDVRQASPEILFKPRD